MLFEKVIGQTKILMLISTVLFFITVISLLTNLLLGISIYSIRTKQDIIILPFDQSQKYLFNNDKYDTNYLQNMGLSFVSLRLNNTPETVHKKHELLLSYVAEASRPDISAILTDEENIIIKDDLTSAFYYDEINVYPDSDVFEIKGTLKTWSGNRSMRDLDKIYQIKVKYLNGRFLIENFVEVKP